MFQGNKPVLILPAILMVIMFIGGYQFLQNSETITNEELKDVIEIGITTHEKNEDLQIEVNWDWTVMPAEGLYGEDYLGIFLIDQSTGEARTDLSFENMSLELFYANDVIRKLSGTVVENGVIFAYPNKLIEHASIGNIGKARIVVKGTDLSPDAIQVKMLHTWTDHSPLEIKDATFASPSFQPAKDVPYWIHSR